MRSIRTKFIVFIALLIILVLAGNAAYLITQKTEELENDLRLNAVSYAELTHKPIADAFELYRESGFINLKNAVSKQKELNPDIVKVQIFAYDGTLLFDDQDQMSRLLTNSEQEVIDDRYLPQVQGRFNDAQDSDLPQSVSDVTLIGSVLKELGLAGRVKDSTFLQVVYPYYDDLEAHRVSVRYLFTYDNLKQRIWNMTLAILALTGISILFSILLASYLAHVITKPIKKLKKGAEIISTGNFSVKVNVQSKDELGVLASTFNQMAADLEVATKERVEKEKLAKELELASEIQSDILPAELPEIPGLSVAASVTSATQVGGDVFDFIKLSEDETVFYIGDVTGHGVPAGLVVSVANALLLNYAQLNQSTVEMAVNTNRIIHAKTGTNIFITMLIMKWFSKKSEFKYTIAGHEQIIHYQSNKNASKFEEAGGMAVGIMPDISALAKERTFKMETGDCIALYSDGIVEAWAPDGETMFGMEGLQESVTRHGQLATAQEIHDAVIKDVRDFMQDAEQMDDITLIIIKRV